MRVVIDALAWISKKDISDVDLFVLKRNLTILPKATSEYKSPVPIELFVEKNDSIGIPREYYFKKKRQSNEDVIAVSDGEVMNKELGFVQLRDYQEPVVQTVKDYLNSGNYGCCIEAETGSGKSPMGLHLARYYGRKTLIIVHKMTLADQWRKRIVGDPDEEDSLLHRGFLPGAKVGIVGDGKREFVGCDFVIALVQSIYGSNLGEDFYESFGFVIIDEIHRMGSEKWGLAARMFPARWKIGLTATARRKDGAENVFFYHVGPIVARLSGQVLKPKIFLYETGLTLIETPTFNPDRLTRDEMMRVITESDMRNKLIAGEVYKALKNERRVLCLVERIDHLEKLVDLTKDLMKSGGESFTIGLFYRGDRKVTQEELDEAKKRDVVFGTIKMIEDGEDVQELDTLILASPLSDAEQAIGRVLRLRKYKKKPVVVDFRDDAILRLRSLGNSRDKLYARKEWDVFSVG